MDLTPVTWGKCHFFTIFKWINSDFYNDQEAVSSPFCSEHIAMTGEIFKRQEERDRKREEERDRKREKERRKEGKKKTMQLF